MANEFRDFRKWPSEDGGAVLFELLLFNIVAHALQLICQCS